jgi:hypothetical protein
VRNRVSSASCRVGNGMELHVECRPFRAYQESTGGTAGCTSAPLRKTAWIRHAKILPRPLIFRKELRNAGRLRRFVRDAEINAFDDLIESAGRANKLFDAGLEEGFQFVA